MSRTNCDKQGKAIYLLTSLTFIGPNTLNIIQHGRERERTLFRNRQDWNWYIYKLKHHMEAIGPTDY